MDHKFAQTFLKLGRNYLGDTNSLLLSQKSYGHDFFPFVSTPFLLVRAAAAAAVGGQTKSSFDLAENCDVSSLGVGRHRYTRVLQVSKLLWV